MSGHYQCLSIPLFFFALIALLVIIICLCLAGVGMLFLYYYYTTTLTATPATATMAFPHIISFVIALSLLYRRALDTWIRSKLAFVLFFFFFFNSERRLGSYMLEGIKE